METGRLEAFSDGVIAVIITIMVLELKAPHGVELRSLAPVVPTFLVYVLSFINVGIYWNNHHHLLQATKRIDGRALWANLHLLFWLSLIPFTANWMGENHFGALPTALYGAVLLMAAVAFVILQAVLIANPHNASLAAALGEDRKGRFSIACLIVAIPLAFYQQWISDALFVIVTLIWFVPDSRIEQRVALDESVP